MNKGTAFCFKIHIRLADHELIIMQKIVWYLFRTYTWCYLFQTYYLNPNQTRSNNELMTLVIPSQLPRYFKVFIFICSYRYTRHYVCMHEGSTTKDTICSTCVIYSLKFVRSIWQISHIYENISLFFYYQLCLMITIKIFQFLLSGLN